MTAQNNSWIKLYRQLLDWEWYRDINVKVLFLHLLLTANYETKKWQGITIEKGQKVTSFAHLAEETGLSVKQVRVALEKLKMTQEVTHEATRRYSIITVNNWSKYQSIGQTDGQAGDTLGTTTKEGKNNKVSKDTLLKSKSYKNSLPLFREWDCIKNKEFCKWLAELEQGLSQSALKRFTPEFIKLKKETYLNFLKTKGFRPNDYVAGLQNWIIKAMEMEGIK